MTGPALLIDENLSPLVASELRKDGHRAFHVNATGHRSVTDAEIMAWAAERDLTIVTKDRDFEQVLFSGRTGKPSVIRISERGHDGIRGATQQVQALRGALPGLARYLEAGAAVTLDRFGLRVDPLPLQRLETRRGKIVAWAPDHAPERARDRSRQR